MTAPFTPTPDMAREYTEIDALRGVADEMEAGL